MKDTSKNKLPSKEMGNLAIALSSGEASLEQAERFYGLLDTTLSLEPLAETTVLLKVFGYLANKNETGASEFLMDELDLESQLQEHEPSGKAGLLFAIPFVVDSEFDALRFPYYPQELGNLPAVLREASVLHPDATVGLSHRLWSASELHNLTHGQMTRILLSFSTQISEGETVLSTPAEELNMVPSHPLVKGECGVPGKRLYYMLGAALLNPSLLEDAYPLGAPSEGRLMSPTADSTGYLLSGEEWTTHVAGAIERAYSLMHGIVAVAAPEGAPQDYRAGLVMARRVGLLDSLEINPSDKKNTELQIESISPYKETLALSVNRIQGKDQVKTFRWQMLSFESQEDCIQELIDFLTELDLMPDIHPVLINSLNGRLSLH